MIVDTTNRRVQNGRAVNIPHVVGYRIGTVEAGSPKTSLAKVFETGGGAENIEPITLIVSHQLLWDALSWWRDTRQGILSAPRNNGVSRPR
jgi:hypothetical protein